MKLFIILLAVGAVLLNLPLDAQLTTTHGNIKLIHARATKTDKKVRIKIIEPAQDQVVEGSDVTVKFTVQGWTPEENGKHLHFILDHHPFQPHYSQEPLVFKKVAPGPHVIRIFPVHEWHETVKQQDALAMVQFYVKGKTGSFPLNAAKPMMVYSTPTGVHESNERLPGQPHSGVLVDWFLHNVSMGSRAGYFVRISVDGNQLMSMKEWRPHYLQGLPPGEHTIKLELLKNGVPVQENWNVQEGTITVK